MKTELKKFFLTVANYSLPENIEKYLESLNSIPEESSHHGYAVFLSESLKFRADRPGTDTDEAFKVFEKQREGGLVKVLYQIVKGKSLYGMAGFHQILKDANLLKPEMTFVLDSNDQGKTFIVREVPLYPWQDGRTTSLLERLKDSACAHFEYGNLNGIYYLACYSLSLSLADKGGGRIKHCERRKCNHFFLRDRNDERIRFCSDECRKIHNQDQVKTDEGREQRAAYMRRRRIVLRERKRAKERREEINSLINQGHTRKQAEKILDDNDA